MKAKVSEQNLQALKKLNNALKFTKSRKSVRYLDYVIDNGDIDVEKTLDENKITLDDKAKKTILGGGALSEGSPLFPLKASPYFIGSWEHYLVLACLSIIVLALPISGVPAIVNTVTNLLTVLTGAFFSIGFLSKVLLNLSKALPTLLLPLSSTKTMYKSGDLTRILKESSWKSLLPNLLSTSAKHAQAKGEAIWSKDPGKVLTAKFISGHKGFFHPEAAAATGEDASPLLGPNAESVELGSP